VLVKQKLNSYIYEFKVVTFLSSVYKLRPDVHFLSSLFVYVTFPERKACENK
jgi:hypothetical protein